MINLVIAYFSKQNVREKFYLAEVIFIIECRIVNITASF